MIRAPLCLVLVALAGCGPSAPSGDRAASEAPTRAFDPPVPRDLPDTVRVRIETEAGAIVVALDHRRAPVTTTNFVRYADDHRFDGTYFYRAARNPYAPRQGFIQGGIAHSARRLLPPIRLEPTTETGLRHRDGTISMAHSTPDTAMGDFVLCLGDQPGLDAHPEKKDRGYAAFGRVVEGMEVARRIFASPAAHHDGSDRIAPPVRIVRVSRAG
ncbi:MAG: peptidylprolyl isomerase [Alphaproteobacteria bacterium]|nr:peptidylprolyl isomerase [Alphaproteobacteria bacterium]MBV9372665.1 peptidylprolyl isomerase [Alphaproteobacteria bacterium]MBV9900185.1 peptidylprolyl isomerase [Alphaproteobacteria bacterium]